MEEQRQRLEEDDVLALGRITLGQNGGLTHDGTLGLLGQLVQSLERAAGGNDIIHDQHPLAAHLVQLLAVDDQLLLASSGDGLVLDDNRVGHIQLDALACADVAEEKAGKRAAYEEMAAAYYLMQRGVPEIQAYSEFGNRCRVLPYRKLAGILEQNVKNGSKSLTPVLEAEMEAAFEQRKNLARRLGEEASTKLLLPLFMMLLIVMVMITVPAFLAFGI